MPAVVQLLGRDGQVTLNRPAALVLLQQDNPALRRRFHTRLHVGERREGDHGFAVGCVGLLVGEELRRGRAFEDFGDRVDRAEAAYLVSL